jgi:septal ring factor EnvC (AmiA/AmiB activator)
MNFEEEAKKRSRCAHVVSVDIPLSLAISGIQTTPKIKEQMQDRLQSATTQIKTINKQFEAYEAEMKAFQQKIAQLESDNAHMTKDRDLCQRIYWQDRQDNEHLQTQHIGYMKHCSKVLSDEELAIRLEKFSTDRV